MKGTVRTLAAALVALALPAAFLAQEGASDRGGEKISVEPRIRGTRSWSCCAGRWSRCAA